MLVLVFGVFDNLHPGHEYLLEQASHYGDSLIVAVTDDHIVLRLKNHPPKQSVQERIKKLKNLPYVTNAVVGDPNINTWGVIKKYKPNIIAFGFDQQKLAWAFIKEKTQFQFVEKYVIIEAFKPEKYKSSLLS